MNDFPIFHQRDSMDCDPTCLQMIAKFYGRHYRLETLRERCAISRTGVSLLGISEAAESLGFHTLGARVRFEELIEENLMPCIAHWNKNHFVVVYDIKCIQGEIAVYVADPSLGKCIYAEAEFCRYWHSSVEKNVPHGVVLTLEPTPLFYEQQEDEVIKRSRKSLLFLYTISALIVVNYGKSVLHY